MNTALCHGTRLQRRHVQVARLACEPGAVTVTLRLRSLAGNTVSSTLAGGEELAVLVALYHSLVGGCDTGRAVAWRCRAVQGTRSLVPEAGTLFLGVAGDLVREAEVLTRGEQAACVEVAVRRSDGVTVVESVTPGGMQRFSLLWAVSLQVGGDAFRDIANAALELLRAAV